MRAPLPTINYRARKPAAVIDGLPDLINIFALITRHNLFKHQVRSGGHKLDLHGGIGQRV